MKSHILLLLALLGASCTKPKPALVCDGPTTMPYESEPCPPGTAVMSHRCPLDTCRHCEKPDGTREGPFLTWYTTEMHVEVIPDKHGRWGNYSKHVRGRLQEAGWFKNGIRNGLFVRWYQNGNRALEATYCNGVVREPVLRWSEQGTPLDAGSGWLTPPDGGT
jgi:hypothetical protein